MGLFLMTSGLGSYLASAIVFIAKAATDGGNNLSYTFIQISCSNYYLLEQNRKACN